MKRANIRSEMAILSVLCNTKKKERQGELWMRLRPEFFGSDATRELYDRILELNDTANAIPTFRTLRRDTKLSDAAKALVKSTDDNILTRDETDVTMTQLKDMYVLRVYADLNEVLAKTLEGSKAPKLDILERVLEESLFSIRNPEGSTQDLLHGGTGDSRASDMLVSILKGDSARDRIKTGYGIFDQKSGGFNRGDLVVLTANFGGGKSVSALTMFRNMNNLKYSTGLATMEMGHREVLERLASSISGVEYNKIRLNTLTKQEKRKVTAAFDTFDNPDKSARWSIYAPTNEVTIKDIFRAMSPYQYDVIFIDYIGLLKQVALNKNAREDQVLGEAARYCKIMAEKLKCVVVLLAQLNDDGKVMYSRAIAHHASWWWKWQCSEEDKQRGFVTVEQGKARGAECYDFTLTTDFAHMQMNNELANEGQPKIKREDSKGGPFRKSDSNADPKAKVKLSLLE